MEHLPDCCSLVLSWGTLLQRPGATPAARGTSREEAGPRAWAPGLLPWGRRLPEMVSAVSPASVCPDGRLAHCAQWSHRSICQALAANRRWEWATCGTGMGVPGGRGAPGLWSWTGAGVPGGERNPAPLVLSPRCADRGPSSATTHRCLRLLEHSGAGHGRSGNHCAQTLWLPSPLARLVGQGHLHSGSTEAEGVESLSRV